MSNVPFRTGKKLLKNVWNINPNEFNKSECWKCGRWSNMGFTGKCSNCGEPSGEETSRDKLKHKTW